MAEKIALVGIRGPQGMQYASTHVVKENALTVWVRMPDGHIIKRHRRKHGVAIQ